jgi:hypothetical protein
MGKSVNDNKKKRSRPRTSGTGELVGVRLLPEPLAGLDHAIRKNGDQLSRPEMLKRIAIRWLVQRGYLAARGSTAERRVNQAADALKAAGAAIDRAQEGSDQSEEIKAYRKKKLLKFPTKLTK